VSKRRTSRNSQADRKRVEGLHDKSIDFSDIPEFTDEQFAKLVVRKGLEGAVGKEQITLRLDADVLAWFRAQGKGYQTQINALLRTYMDAHTSAKRGARRP
jgi:uncharacterized protein (DUF4415 family)